MAATAKDKGIKFREIMEKFRKGTLTAPNGKKVTTRSEAMDLAVKELHAM